jgi:hypothetical protein
LSTKFHEVKKMNVWEHEVSMRTRHCSYHNYNTKFWHSIFQNSNLFFLLIWDPLLLRIWGNWNTHYHSSAISFFKVSSYWLKNLFHMMLRKSESWESAAYALNWHLSFINYYNVNFMQWIFFVKSVLSLDSQRTDFGRVMRLQFLYLGRTIWSKTEAKLRRLASSNKTH